MPTPDSSINKTSTSAFTSSATNPTTSTNPFQIGNESTEAASSVNNKEQVEDRKAGQDALDKISEPDEGYEQKMEEEYAKREGGA